MRKLQSSIPAADEPTVPWKMFWSLKRIWPSFIPFSSPITPFYHSAFAGCLDVGLSQHSKLLIKKTIKPTKLFSKRVAF